MSMDTFQELQQIFRLYYSRPTTDFAQPKKKIRRVVSASSVPASTRLTASDALGIFDHGSPRPSDIQPTRKHVLPGSEPTAKRCKRVLSEFSSRSLSSLCDSRDMPSDRESMNPLWLVTYQDSPTASAKADGVSLLPLHATTLLQTPGGYAGSGQDPCVSPTGTSGSTSMAAATAAALTAAAMAAAASNTGLDDSFDSPSLHHLSQFLPSTIVGQRPYIPGSTCSIMPFGSSAISGQQNTISAFATATGATPDRFPDEILQMHSQQLFPSDQSSCSISSDTPGAAAMNRLYSDMCLAELAGGGYLPIATTWDKIATDSFEEVGRDTEACVDHGLASLVETAQSPLASSNPTAQVFAALDQRTPDVPCLGPPQAHHTGRINAAMSPRTDVTASSQTTIASTVLGESARGYAAQSAPPVLADLRQALGTGEPAKASCGRASDAECLAPLATSQPELWQQVLGESSSWLSGLDSVLGSAPSASLLPVQSAAGNDSGDWYSAFVRYLQGVE
ncbi:hypothetical protein EC988_005820 [Linderina pennispora]|nr:hypothetical protein EC988_005820 [Linderina pennispora]